MKVLVAGNDFTLSPKTRSLLRRMHCPLTGLSQEIGLLAPSASDPKLCVAGGEMTGIHVLRGTPAPARGAYHIGGSGFTLEESIIRTLGETVERYAQYIVFGDPKTVIVSASLNELIAQGETPLVVPDLAFFEAEQLARPGFPFQPITPDTPIGWLRGVELPDLTPCLVPAQQGSVGYHRRLGEPRFAEGVTTGSAAHTRPPLAIRSALLELIQIDAAMGHWYGGGRCIELAPGLRTRCVERAIQRRLAPSSKIRFFWLQSADLPGFAVACLQSSRNLPRVVVGLGCDLVLDQAMYKAFLEATAVVHLAKMLLLQEGLESAPDSRTVRDDTYDLDSNVAHYAKHPARVQVRFGGEYRISSDDVPPDFSASPEEQVKYLIDGFRTSGKRIALLNLRSPDIAALGFYVYRVWSPEVLTLSLPSAPPALHPRFSDYGGFLNSEPHPYP